MPLSREQLLEAVEENSEELFGLFASYYPPARFERDEHIRKMSFGVPVAFFNGVAMARLDPEDCDAQIQSAIAEMEATGMPWSWQVGPGSKPYDLTRRLINGGMRYGYDMPIMVADLRDWNPAPARGDLQITEVQDMETYERWMDVAMEAFGLPKVVFDVMRTAQTGIGHGEDATVRNFLAIANGEPVSTSTVFYGHGIAGIYTVGTPEGHRGHGYGTAVTAACMAHAKQKGFDTAFLQSSKMGYPVYQKLGFQEICTLSVYVPQEH